MPQDDGGKCCSGTKGPDEEAHSDNEQEGILRSGNDSGLLAEDGLSEPSEDSDESEDSSDKRGNHSLRRKCAKMH